MSGKAPTAVMGCPAAYVFVLWLRNGAQPDCLSPPICCGLTRSSIAQCCALLPSGSGLGVSVQALLQYPPPPVSVSAGVGKPPHGLGGCIWMPLVNGTGNSPVSGTADPRNSQTGQAIRGLR